MSRPECEMTGWHYEDLSCCMDLVHVHEDCMVHGCHARFDPDLAGLDQATGWYWPIDSMEADDLPAHDHRSRSERIAHGPSEADLAYVRALDATTRPRAEKISGQYVKGLLSLAECIEELTQILYAGQNQVLGEHVEQLPHPALVRDGLDPNECGECGRVHPERGDQDG